MAKILLLSMDGSQCKKFGWLGIILIISLWLGCSSQRSGGFPVALSSDHGEEKFESVYIDIVGNFYDLRFHNRDFQRLERYTNGAIGKVVAVKIGDSTLSSATLAEIISDGRIRVPIGKPGMKDDQVESIKKAMEAVLGH